MWIKTKIAVGLIAVVLICGGCGRGPVAEASVKSPQVMTPHGPVLHGWSSGGGEPLGNAINPWFLENTKRVSYCIEASEKFRTKKFLDANGPLPLIVEGVLDFWVAEFRFANAYSPKYYSFVEGADFQVKLATQKFVLEDCSQDTDLRIQFGVLSEPQRQYLKDPAAHIAVAVRTQYDEVEMRGKGFIYVSPDSGPERYRGAHLLDDGYQEGGPLREVLRHELGHVFGVPHTAQKSVMAMDYPDSLLGRPDLRAFGFGVPLFQVAETQELSFALDDKTRNLLLRAFLGISTDVETLGIRYSSESHSIEVRDLLYLGAKRSRSLLGHMKLSPTPHRTRVQPLVRIKISDENRALPILSAYRPLLEGPGLVELSYSASYTSADGLTKRSALVRFFPSQQLGDGKAYRGIEIGGEVAGEFYSDLLPKH